MFSKEVYITRRNALRNEFNSGLLIFIGNDDSAMNYEDNTYHFRQDSSFLYYFGLNSPGLAAVIDIDQNEDILFGDDLTIDHIIWMGPQPSVSEQAVGAGIEKTLPFAAFINLLNKNKGKRTIHFLPVYRPEHRIKLFNWLDIPLNETNNHASVELIMAVSEQRNSKGPEEIGRLESIVSVTADMHTAAMQFARAGMTEAIVAARVHEVALAAGGNISFPIIATINGQTLHNHYHGNTLKEGDLFLLDAGGEDDMGYAGDMSSTFPVSAKFTQRQKEIYQIQLDAHANAVTACKPGINYKEVHFAAARTIFNGLKELGLTKGNTDEAVAAGAHALFFPHGVGHLLGLDVHDMENLGEKYVGYAGAEKSTQFGLKSLRLARELKSGYVVTIEPGVYFIPELIDLWHAERKFIDYINYDKVVAYKDFGGVRNEEDVLITETGHKVLGKPLAKTITEVEAERAKAF